MINETVDVEINTESVKARIREYFGADTYRHIERSSNIDAVADMLIAFLDLDEDDRKTFLRSIAALVCDKCGKPSCLCGYPDC